MLLISIAVDEEHRNKGIAKNLIKILLNTCKRTNKIERCILNVRENSNQKAKRN